MPSREKSVPHRRFAHRLHLVDALVHGVVRVEPLAVLLVAVEDKGLADEAFAHQFEHVLHGGCIAEGQPDLGLQPFGFGQMVRAPDVPIVVTDGLLHQTVLARFQHGEDHLLVIGPRHHVDHVDVGPGQHLFEVGDKFGNAKLLGPSLAQLAVQIAQHHHVAQGRTGKAGQMG